MNTSYYTNLFRVDRPTMEKVIARALSQGGDWCDLYFEHTVTSKLSLKDSAVDTGSANIDFGVGIRVLSGDRTGYAYAETTDLAEMLRAAEVAGSIASGTGKASCVNVSASPACAYPVLPAGSLYPEDGGWRNFSPREYLSFLEGIDRKARSRDSRLVRLLARITCSESDCLMFNSLGEMATDTRPLCSVTATAIFAQNGRTESRTAARSFRKGAAMVDEGLSDALVEELAEGLDARFEAGRPKGGQMSVVMGAGASGILLHEAMGHAFEADFNRKGQSIFSGRMGERICPRGISIIDDGTIPFNRGCGRFDDEGVPGQKTFMVTDGVLTSYLHDRISAAFYGVPPTGNGRRESFRFNPIPRMRATYMESGTARPEDIVASVRKGIYVDEFSNGQVKIGEGDFTFFVKSGFLIENGRLTMPVKDINVIGNGPEALSRIEAVGCDLRIDDSTWTCGKEQNVPVSCGIPTVLVSSLTVGGN